MRLALILAALLVSGCDRPRNSVVEQAEDFAVCKKAGMRAYMNGYGEIRCAPPTTAGKANEP